MVAPEKTFDDLAYLEIAAAKKKVISIEREIKKIQKQVISLGKKVDRLEDELCDAEKTLGKTRRSAAKLKKSVWSSKDPNIIELRNQLLLAAKLIKD